MKDCDWDGGDCAKKKENLGAVHPNCKVKFPSWIGDGWCNGDEYNALECGWDGGDYRNY